MSWSVSHSRQAGVHGQSTTCAVEMVWVAAHEVAGLFAFYNVRHLGIRGAIPVHFLVL